VESAWASPFDSPEPLPKPTPEQLAGMEQFRALLDPPAEPTPQAAGFSAQPVAAVDPNMERLPVFNPAGRSFTALGNDIGRPVGLQPLAGVTGPLPPPKKPAPVVQTPPWMQDPLQTGTMPQRQF
jgi:hypothetical protein